MASTDTETQQDAVLTGPETDVTREHIRRVLKAQRRAEDARLRRAEELERAGRRIVEGGQVSHDRWVIRDWRTDEVLAEGNGGLDEYDAVATRLDPDHTWFHADHLYDDEPEPYVTTPGMPPSLGAAIEDWVAAPASPDEEIAEFVGWSIEKVQEHR